MRLTSILLVAFFLPTAIARAGSIVTVADWTGWEDGGGSQQFSRVYRDFHFDEPTKLALDYHATLTQVFNSMFGNSAQPVSFSITGPGFGVDIGLPEVGYPIDDDWVSGTVLPNIVGEYAGTLTSSVLPAGDYRVDVKASSPWTMSLGGGSANVTIDNVYLLPIPEPATWLLAAIAAPALAAIVFRGRRECSH